MIYVSSSGEAKRIEDMAYPYLVNARRKLNEAIESKDEAALARQQVHPEALVEAMDTRIREMDAEREPPVRDDGVTDYMQYDDVEFGT